MFNFSQCCLHPLVSSGRLLPAVGMLYEIQIPLLHIFCGPPPQTVSVETCELTLRLDKQEPRLCNCTTYDVFKNILAEKCDISKWAELNVMICDITKSLEAQYDVKTGTQQCSENRGGICVQQPN